MNYFCQVVHELPFSRHAKLLLNLCPEKRYPNNHELENINILHYSYKDRLGYIEVEAGPLALAIAHAQKDLLMRCHRSAMSQPSPQMVRGCL